MNLYLAMPVRGEEGNNVTETTMYENKGKAIAIGTLIREAIGEWHNVIVPHMDCVLDAIDWEFIETRDESLVTLAMNRCEDLLLKCDGVIALGVMSEGMKNEVSLAEEMGMLIYQNENTQDFLEDLVLSINAYELGEKDESDS